MMDKIADMMKTWTGPGQGIFLLIIAGMFFGAITVSIRYLTVLVRGWPTDPVSQRFIVKGEE